MRHHEEAALGRELEALGLRHRGTHRHPVAGEHGGFDQLRLHVERPA